MLINTSISDRTVQNFKFLVANLTSEIISKKTSNACSSVRGLQDNPNILIKFVQLNLEMTMVSNDKIMLEKCEKYLEDKVKKFNLLNQQIIKTIVKERNNPIYYENTDEVNKVLIEVVKQFESGGLEAFIENQTDAESKIKYATLMINLINSIERTHQKSDSIIYEIDFVKKSFREVRKKENKLLMYFKPIYNNSDNYVNLFFFDKKLVIKIKKIQKFFKILRFFY